MKLIVARGEQALYEYLKWGFADVPGIQVILDRRLFTRRERRPTSGPEIDQRRGADRRRVAGRAELLARGFVIAR